MTVVALNAVINQIHGISAYRLLLIFTSKWQHATFRMFYASVDLKWKWLKLKAHTVIFCIALLASE